MKLILCDNKPIRANVVNYQEGENGWVEFEDLTILNTSPSEEVEDPNVAYVETSEDLETPVVSLPVRRIHGKVEVKHFSDA